MKKGEILLGKDVIKKEDIELLMVKKETEIKQDFLKRLIKTIIEYGDIYTFLGAKHFKELWNKDFSSMSNKLLEADIDISEKDKATFMRELMCFGGQDELGIAESNLDYYKRQVERAEGIIMDFDDKIKEKIVYDHLRYYASWTTQGNTKSTFDARLKEAVERNKPKKKKVKK